jgi:hypothetical protein
LPLTWRGGQPPTGGANRYLFLTATRGLRDVLVSESPVFVHPFAAHDLPNAAIDAVWFTGDRYVAAEWSAWVEFDRADRELTVTLTPDAARYAPGDPVRLAVKTADGEGRPVAATVILRAIDEKLYAIHAAAEESPLGDLYMDVASGIVTTYASHPLPSAPPGRDTTGGGDGGLGPVRVDFRDSVLFRRVTTDDGGQASVTFTLGDDITAWRISGAAITADLRAGQASVSVAAGLPLFIEAPLAPDYLVSDSPTLLVRAYGTALARGQAVTYTVSAPSLGLAPTSVVGSAFTSAVMPLPALVVGEHDVRIEARSGSGSAVVRDTLVRKIRVVESRFTQTSAAHVVLPAALPEATGTGMATYVFADEGRGRYLWPVRKLAWGGGDRVDQALASLIARDVLRESFGIDEDASSGYPYAVERYHKEPVTTVEGMNRGAGIALLPWGSPEVALSARVSLLAAERFNGWALGDYFRVIRADPAATREQKTLALAGLAGLAARSTADIVSEPVADLVVVALADPALTVRERLYLALAAATLGDHPTALATERALLEAYGQRFGPWIRLRSARPENDARGDVRRAHRGHRRRPIAEAAEAYVEERFTLRTHISKAPTITGRDRAGTRRRRASPMPCRCRPRRRPQSGRDVLAVPDPRPAGHAVGPDAARTDRRDGELGGAVGPVLGGPRPLAVADADDDAGVARPGGLGRDGHAQAALRGAHDRRLLSGRRAGAVRPPAAHLGVGRDARQRGRDALGDQRPEGRLLHRPVVVPPAAARVLRAGRHPGMYAWEPAVMQASGPPRARPYSWHGGHP